MREAVAHLQACHGMSERRACRVIDADRKSVRYRSTRDDDAVHLIQFLVREIGKISRKSEVRP